MTRPNSQGDKKAPDKVEVNLQKALEKRLLGYAVSAGAAAGLAAAPPPALADIVFTPANISLHAGSTIPINIHGTPGFTLTDRFYIITGSWSTALLNVTLSGGAGVVARNGSAAALRFGATIGSADAFQGGKVVMAGAFRETQISSSRVWGPFANTTDRYLGLKFTIQGQVHYGWARISSVITTANGPAITARFTGYALETVANQSIYAGQTRYTPPGARLALPPGGPSGERTPELEPASLGLLALGSQGLNAWRKKENLEQPPA
jgi:hypothetical protein